MYKKIFLLLIMVTFILTGCKNKEKVEADKVVIGKRNVKTALAKSGNINTYVKYSGKIEAKDIANASPAISGKIEKLFVKEGDVVKTGDLLVKLDQTQLEQTRIQFENAKNNYVRMHKLLDSDAVDKQTFEEVEAGYNVAKSSYEFMQENIEMKAPIPGTVSSIYKQEGEKYDSMMDPFLIRIVNSDKFIAKVQISDKDINAIKKGQKAIIKLDNNEKEFLGIVTFVSPEADMMAGTFPVEIEIKNADSSLKHNQFARISFIIESSSNTVIVPQQSVIENGFVLVANNGIAEKREVELGIGNEKQIEIVSGISAGEEVIITGNIGLKDGDSLSIKN